MFIDDDDRFMDEDFDNLESSISATDDEMDIDTQVVPMEIDTTPVVGGEIEGTWVPPDAIEPAAAPTQAPDDPRTEEEKTYDELFPRDPKGKKGKRWQARRVVGVNYDMNWNPHERDFDGEMVRYIHAQKEPCPKTGKLHWQYYAQFRPQVTSRGKAQALLFVGKSWIDVARGTPKEAIAYCNKTKESCAEHDKICAKGREWGSKGWRKEGTTPFVWGKPSMASCSGEGSIRWDIEGVKEQILLALQENDRTILDKIRRNHLGLWAQYGKVFREFWDRELYLMSPDRRPIILKVFWGETGAGKTRAAADMANLEYGPKQFYRVVFNKGGQAWFNKYENQKVIILEEFTGGKSDHAYILQLLDRYAVEVESKGGTAWGNWEAIYITCNMHPKAWFNYYEKLDLSEENAMKRRLMGGVYQVTCKHDAPDTNVPWDAVEAGTFTYGSKAEPLVAATELDQARADRFRQAQTDRRKAVTELITGDKSIAGKILEKLKKAAK